MFIKSTNKTILQVLVFLAYFGCQNNEEDKYVQTKPAPIPNIEQPPESEAPVPPTEEVESVPDAEKNGPVFIALAPTDITANEGEVIAFALSATGNEISYSSQCASLCPSSLVISSTGEVRWSLSYTDAGVYDVRFAATDREGITAVTPYTRIRIANVNRKPIVSSVIVIADNDDSPSSYTCNVIATDPDPSDIITISRRWVVNGGLPSAGRLTNKTVSISSLGPSGSLVSCEATASDIQRAVSDTSMSEPIKIPNSAPTIITSGVISNVASSAGAVVPESLDAKTFKVGDQVRCAVSLFDREGGAMAISSMQLVALPISTPEGELQTRFSDVLPATDTFGSPSEVIASFSGAELTFMQAPPVEYFGRTFPAGSLFAVGHSVGAYTIEKKYAHRPLTCVASVIDGDKSVSGASFATRVSNSAPTMTSIAIVPDSALPNYVLGGSYAIRTGGKVRCVASYEDADGDQIIPTVRFINRRGELARERISPQVSWASSCINSSGKCSVSGIYTLKRWTDISGPETTKQSLTDIKGDEISCTTTVADVTSYGPLTADLVSGSLSITDSPPSILNTSSTSPAMRLDGAIASGATLQTIHTDESFIPLTVVGADPDGDAVEYKIATVAGSPDCSLSNLSIGLDMSASPAAIVQQVGRVPAMAFPHHDRSCKTSIYAESGPASSKLRSDTIILSLNIPNRAPKLFCGTRLDVAQILGSTDKRMSYSRTAAPTVVRYLKTAPEDGLGRPTSQGQFLGLDELGGSASSEADLTSFVCAVVDLDGDLSGSQAASIVAMGSEAFSSNDAFSWRLEASGANSGCGYFLADGVSSVQIGLEPFGSSEMVVGRKVVFGMGVQSCKGRLIVRDGDAANPQALFSNDVSFEISPKITITAGAPKLDQYCRLSVPINSSVGDPNRYKFRTPEVIDVISQSTTLSGKDFPASISLTVGSPGETRSFSDLRNSTANTWDMRPVSLGVFDELMSSPSGYAFIGMSRPRSEDKIAPSQLDNTFFYEDAIDGSRTLSAALTVTASDKETNENVSARTMVRDIQVSQASLLLSDILMSPRSPSFQRGVFGMDGMQSPRVSGCLSESSCSGMESSIASGEAHTCFLTTSGGVSCLGSNTRGQSGRIALSGAPFEATGVVTPAVRNIGDTCSIDYQGTNTPCSLNGSDTPKIRAITAGVAHTCGLTRDGTVMCWGDNTFGQLGAGENISAGPGDDMFVLPRPQAEYVMVSANQKLQNIISVSAGPWHTCALSLAKEVFCWGANPEPIYTLTNIESTYCGPGNSNRCVKNPVKIDGLTGVIGISAGGFGSRLQMGGLAPGNNYIGGTTCGLKDNGEVICIGDNIYGLGGSQEATATPVVTQGIQRAASLIEAFVLNLSGFSGLKPELLANKAISISIGRLIGCAISEIGAKCWGGGSPGSVADPFGLGGGLRPVGILDSENINYTAVPVATNIDSSAGKTLGVGFSCEIGSLGTHKAIARCVGNNHYIKGLTEMSAVPVQEYGALGSGINTPSVSGEMGGMVLGPDGLPLDDLVAISAGSYHACAVRYSGEIYCWGSNFAGQTGLGPDDLPLQASSRARKIATSGAVKRCDQIIRAKFRE